MHIFTRYNVKLLLPQFLRKKLIRKKGVWNFSDAFLVLDILSAKIYEFYIYFLCTLWYTIKNTNKGCVLVKPKYNRILLKLSGEALAGNKQMGLSYDVITSFGKAIKKTVDAGVEVGIVVGGGNFWRGRSSGAMDRTRADHIGMLATAMNALAVADGLENCGLEVRVQTAISMPQVAEPYIRNRAMRHFEKGRVVIFGCGTGNPFFSTDTAAALRAAEIEADIFFKATMVDGVYDKDPHKFSDAVKYDELSFDEILSKGLKVMDSTAAAMCKDNDIPIYVFDLADPENIYRACMGESVGTKVTNRK